MDIPFAWMRGLLLVAGCPRVAEGPAGTASRGPFLRNLPIRETAANDKKFRSLSGFEL
jgi:hypothetical protein